MDPDINVKMIEEVANAFKHVEDGIAIGTDSDSGLKYRDLEREWSNKGRGDAYRDGKATSPPTRIIYYLGRLDLEVGILSR
jgi:hypothetical protein